MRETACCVRRVSMLESLRVAKQGCSTFLDADLSRRAFLLARLFGNRLASNASDNANRARAVAGLGPTFLGRLGRRNLCAPGWGHDVRD